MADIPMAKILSKLTTFRKTSTKKVLQIIDTYPFASFLGTLAVLLVLIILGQFLRQTPSVEETTTPEPTVVSIYQNGVSPTITVTGQIEKSGVITIKAQTGGIVQKVPVTEGQYVTRGKTLVSLSTNYQGGNSATVSRQIAQRNAQFSNETYDLQKSTVAQQREVANNQAAQAAELREINRKSVSETKDLIALNESIINSLNTQIADLEAINVNGASDSAILAVKQGKAQVEAGLLNLRSSLRSAEYSTTENQEPARLAELSKEITLKQLDLQERSLDLSKDINNLQVKLARVSEALMFPTTPCAGIVERVFVNIGDTVTPGTPLAVIRADSREVTAVVNVPPDIARRVSRAEQSIFTVENQTFAVAPRYISAEPVEGDLHTILYSIPGEYEAYLSNGQQIAVQLPLGASVASTADRFIPLDAVYQTQDTAFVYIAAQQDGQLRAQVKEVELGAVSGSYVKVVAGLEDADTVITTRGMTDGELIQVAEYAE